MTTPATAAVRPAATAASILIVDDDANLRTRLQRAFSQRGLEARAAAGFAEAVEEARRDSPELAVIDLRMPGRGGLELLRELKAIDPTTRCLVLTGFGSLATAVEAMRLGADGYLQKPADADDILQAFTRAEHPPLTHLDDDGGRAPSPDRVKWEHIQRVLGETGGNISAAARRMGMHRRTLQRILHKHPPSR
ncbi:MAG: response regulator [Myxococcales bacterium]|nr:response regulator [Myxococcales bacterium]